MAAAGGEWPEPKPDQSFRDYLVEFTGVHRAFWAVAFRELRELEASAPAWLSPAEKWRATDVILNMLVDHVVLDVRATLAGATAAKGAAPLLWELAAEISRPRPGKGGRGSVWKGREGELLVKLVDVGLQLARAAGRKATVLSVVAELKAMWPSMYRWHSSGAMVTGYKRARRRLGQNSAN